MSVGSDGDWTPLDPETQSEYKRGLLHDDSRVDRTQRAGTCWNNGTADTWRRKCRQHCQYHITHQCISERLLLACVQ